MRDVTKARYKGSSQRLVATGKPTDIGAVDRGRSMGALGSASCRRLPRGRAQLRPRLLGAGADRGSDWVALLTHPGASDALMLDIAY